MKTLDEKWMRGALELAEKGRRHVSPNPLVGALVVKKGKVIGGGCHSYFGGPHAEQVALEKSGPRAKQATLYVTLEPCSTWGKTSPCVERVIASGVAQVVIGSPDPNPRHFRRGIRRLKQSGIKVRTGVLAEDVERQNRGFFKVMRTGYPHVTLKMAQSLDGKIATRKGSSRWISSAPARQLVHDLRDEADAVLVGKNTALQDNPRLQGVKGREKPWRVVLDPDRELSPKARVFRGAQLTLVAVSERKLTATNKTSLLRPYGARKDGQGWILIPTREKNGKLDLTLLLRTLASLGVHSLLVEGGGEVAWSLINQKRVDRLIWIVAPKIIGGRNAKTSVEGLGVEIPSQAIPLRWERVYRLGPDWVFEATPVKGRG
jgi:diaminohydroxyphosphoribosylaminopyrimidine deaminase/5-amino-6-(5-phosphoribosylamino)uracil reductase